jgi:DNA modification methylase
VAQPLLRQSWSVVAGDCRESLAAMEPGSVQTCVTSPPYFGLRDYGHEGQIGLEPTPTEYVENLVAVFRAAREVLADDGTLWLNLGDSYSSSPPGNKGEGAQRYRSSGLHGAVSETYAKTLDNSVSQKVDTSRLPGIKPKDLLGIPWLVAFALRADGWYLRSEIIWAKTSCMPEAVKDRPTKAHETVFLLSKQPRYFYDADAIREPSDHPHLVGRPQKVSYHDESAMRQDGDRVAERTEDRNKRTVWTVATHPFPGAHFATFPPKLIEPCILAGSRVGDVVLDPFAGSGTTGMVALRHDRSFIGCELNPAYVDLARDRIIADSPLLNTNAEMAA